MADNLIFPIGFDLEKAVNEAGQQWDKKYAKRLEQLIAKRPIKVKLEFEKLEDVKKRLAELKIQPITKETRSAIRELAKELQQLAKALEQVQKFSKITQLGQRNFTNDVQLEKLRQANERLEIQKRRVALAEQKHAEAMQRSASKSKELSAELQKQEGYISRLIKRTAAYWSFNQVSTFLTRVRDVTAEFELQRVSLGAIIQDQQKANQLFGEIKSFALKSPLKILDLTKYTKQVAAYRIETDKLFDTTKRLADVSVGLGVDMGRLVLAYGQVKAASYLRAAEIRQFTEAGIPLLELLAEKFTELQGSAVSTEEVMDKVSRRMVSFSMVEEIFKDMTDAGGMFYNMQEKQSQTLYGMWAKMGDAAAVMYDQIGNTATVNSGMKYLIQLLQDSMLHWTAFANVLQTGVLGITAYKAAMAGLVPFYNLNKIQIMANIKAEKSQQALMSKRLSLYATLTVAQARAIATQKKLTTAEWEEYITKTKLNQISALRLARISKENAALQKALVNQKLYTSAQLQQIQSMSKGQYLLANIKSGFLEIGGAIKSLWATFKTFLPLAALTAVIDLFIDWRQSVSAQEAAVKKVDKQYDEMKVTLLEIENAYRDIQSASKSAAQSEEEFAKTSYSQKLEQLKNIMKLLSQFGLKNTIDLSVLNYENIDPVIDNWIKKLNEVNELSQKWGRSVAEVANAYEGNIFGWSIFGENLNEDMKDLSRSWTKLTVNTEFNNSLRQLKAIVGELANENKGVYDQISKAVGIDLKLALAQKRRNESEVQYQQRIYKNYQDIESYLQAFRNKGEYGGMLPSLSAADVADRFGDFKSDLDEVMHEIRKTIAAFENEEPMTIRMAIDQQFTLNEWEEWQKELVIQELNKDRLKVGLDLIPTLSSAATGAVAEGLKAIITSEFPTLFNENELQSLVSAEGIVEAIKTKLDASNESLEKSVQLQNNLAYGSKGFENSLDRVKKLQQEITDIENMRSELADLDARNGNLTSDELLRRSELQAKLQEVDEASLNTKRAQIAAIVEANAKYDEQIQKQRESAEAEREIAKAALERVSSMGLSDLGKDVKEQFGGLMVDAVKEMTDKNYSTDFLIPDEDLKKVRDIGDLYAQWAQNTKAIKDEKEKLLGVGINEATIEKERAALEKKRAEIQMQISAVEAEISNEKFKGQEAQYATLKLALANATTAEAQKTAQENLNKFLGDTKNAEFAILMLKKEGLKTSLQEALVSESANTQIADYLKGLDDAEKLWEELGKRYNFKLPDKDNGRGGSGEDPWIILMKNRMKFMQDFQKGVEDLSKWMGYTKGLADEQENMLGRGLSLKIDSRQLDGTKEELIKWYEDSIAEIRKKIAQMGGKEWEGLGVQMILAKDTKNRVLKKYQELLADMFKELTDFRTEQTQKALEAKIKELADRISRTKTAKEFYEKILSQTGDVELATRVSLSIYGSTGEELFEDTVAQIREVFKSGKEDVVIDLEPVFDMTNQRIDYKMLADIYEKYQNDIIDKNRDTAKKIAQEGQKTTASNITNWQKELAKAKDFEQQRTDIIRTAAAEREKIIKEVRDPEERKSLLNLSREKESQDLSKLNFEEFTKSEDYIKIFENLDNTATSTLKRLRTELQALIDTNKDLSPENMKTLVKAMEDIDEQISGRGFGNDMVQSVNDYIASIKNLKIAKQELAKAEAEYEAQEPRLYIDIETAKAEKESADADVVAAQKELLDIQTQMAALREQEIVDETQLAALQAQEVAASNALTSAELKQNQAATAVVKAEQAKAKAADKVKKAEQKVSGEQDKQKKATTKFFKDLQQVAATADQLASVLGDVQEILGISEDSAAGLVFDSAIQGLQEFSKIMNVIIGLQTLYNIVTSSNPWLAIAAAVLAVGSILGSWISGSKVRKANKEIERQQELLDQLEYTYGRLQNAADKLFGTDYLNNYNQQLKNLQAQQQAYLKQAQAERSKGKKEDKEKTKEYLENARDVADQIKELQDDLVAHFTGSSRTDVARQMAQSWIDARASMSDTFAAIKGDYSDMIKNMIVEGAAARVIENALTPVWNNMEKMLAKNDIDGAIDSLVNGMDAALTQANNGMEVLWKALEARGYDMKQLIGDVDSEYTGVAKDIAGATSEEINTAAAIGNTIMYHTSHLPIISQNVAAMYQLMSQGKTTLSDSGSTGWTDWQQQAMDNYKAIARNTADTVVECRRAAVACEAATEKLNRAFRAKGATSGFNVFLNS